MNGSSTFLPPSGDSEPAGIPTVFVKEKMQLSLARKALETLQNEGMGAAVHKAGRRARYAVMRIRHRRVPAEERWLEMKDMFAGERVFLIGNGPSLNKTPLHLLKNEFTLCFNRFYLMLERLNWRPTFYMAVDDLVLDDLVPEMQDLLDAASLFFFPDIHFRGKRYDDRIGHHNSILWLKQKNYRGFSTQLPLVSTGGAGGTVAYEGFQVLRHLGFKEICVIGMDMNFQIHETARRLGGDGVSIRSQADDDPNHFDPRYFGAQRAYHQPEPRVVRAIVSSLEYLASVAPSHGMRIRNAGIDSALDCFEKVEFQSLFAMSPDAQDNLFNEALGAISDYTEWTRMVQQTPVLSHGTEYLPESGDFTTDLATGLPLIPKAIFSHIPLGPHAGRYFFLRRRQCS